jgi:hypothetical protein
MIAPVLAAWGFVIFPQMHTMCFDQISTLHWGSVAHAQIPSYSGGRDQEDRNSRRAWVSTL